MYNEQGRRNKKMKKNKKTSMTFFYLIAILLIVMYSLAVNAENRTQARGRLKSTEDRLNKLDNGTAAFGGSIKSVDLVSSQLTANVMAASVRRGAAGFGILVPGKEVTVAISPDTVIKRGTQTIALGDVLPGDIFRAVVVVADGKITSKTINVLTKDGTKRLEKTEAVGKRVANVLGNSFNRFDKIITKMEEQIITLKSNGTDTSKAEAYLSEAKTGLVEAKQLLNETRALIDLISESEDPKAAVEDAKESMRATISKAKEVTASLKKAHTEIKSIRKSK